MESETASEQKSRWPEAQNICEDNKASRTDITEKTNQHSERGGRRRRGDPRGRGDNRRWPDRRDQRINHYQRSKPAYAKNEKQNDEGQEERPRRDRDIVGFLNRKLKQDKEVVADTRRHFHKEDYEQSSETIYNKDADKTTSFKEEGASARHIGDKELVGKSVKQNTSQTRREKEINYFERRPDQRNTQNFPGKFVSYPKTHYNSFQMYQDHVVHDGNEAFMHSAGDYYRGNRRRGVNQRKNNPKRIEMSQSIRNENNSRRDTKIMKEQSVASLGDNSEQILNVDNSDKFIHRSTFNDSQPEKWKENNPVDSTTFFLHNRSREHLGHMLDSSRRNEGSHIEYGSGSQRRNYRPKMKGWRQGGISSKFQSSQAGALIEQLRSETYECMVCCDRIRCSAPVWSCSNCYHVFHLKCIRKWANSPSSAVVGGDDRGWRCPACQNIEQQVPNVYWCYCGKVAEPRWNIRDGITPHSCGELCQKKRDLNDCPHPCNQLCHPGPCPSCPVVVSKECACGKTKNQIRCGQMYSVLCKEVCEKPLNCKIHKCAKPCHTGSCGICEIQVKQECYCGKESREVLCGEGEKDTIDGKEGYFSCQQVCEKFLDCGNHKCVRICHQGQCTPCALKPSLVTHCPCGKTTISELLGEEHPRVSCTDGIPTCNYTCCKILPCSPQGQAVSGGRQHLCKKPCHHGVCGPCEGISVIMCRCGAKTKEIPCADRKIGELFLCERRCNKKKQCSRHRCNQKCCVDLEHNCDLVCGKKLRCGLHNCDEPCHPGYCHRCWNVSFDELACYCGASIMYPPIPCGAVPPDCNRPCSRQHSCSHPVNHTCHNEESCPPCTALVKKMCMGQHEMRYNIPCHVTDVTCGKPCGKTLPCGHTCPKSCHKGLCSNEACRQPCKEERKECGHPCGALCHPGSPCPPVPCKVKIKVSCKCGRKTEKVPCLQGGDRSALTQAYQRLTTETLASKMRDLQAGISVDVSAIMHFDEKKPRQIECDDECGVYERNRRLADALQIEDADLSPHVGQHYSPFLLDEAKRNLGFIKSIEEALENLVTIILKSQSSQRTHNFQPMNSNQRRVIHEMAAIYNCTSRSYDQEPLRNTVVTATKESRLPNTKLSSKIEQELNPTPPQPVPFLPSTTLNTPRSKESKTNGVKREQAWAQAPDYFADDFKD